MIDRNTVTIDQLLELIHSGKHAARLTMDRAIACDLKAMRDYGEDAQRAMRNVVAGSRWVYESFNDMEFALEDVRLSALEERAYET